MRVVHVLESLGSGGAENFVLDLTKAQIEKGHDVRIISLGNKNSYESKIAEYGLNIEFCGFYGTIRNVENLYQTRCILANKIDYMAPDIIHSHSFLPDVLTRCVDRRKASLYTTFHTNQPWWAADKLKAKIKTKTEALFSAYGKVSHFIAVSDAARNGAIECLKIPEKNISVIENGIDMNRFQRATGVNDDCSYIVHVGRFTEEKAHDVVIHSFSIVEKEFPNMMLYLVGDGPLRPKIESLVDRLNLRAKVKFLGVRQDVASLLCNARLFVLPSRREGLPIALLEAMASRLPVIATTVGNIPNVIQDSKNGILISADDQGACAAAILRVLKNKEFADAIANSAWQTVRQRYTIAICVEKYVDIYQRYMFR